MTADNEINVRVTATTDGVEDGMRRASASIKQFGSAVEGLGPQVTAASKGYNQDLMAALAAVDAPLKNVSASMALATTQAKTFALGTSGATRELVIMGREAISGNFTRMPGSLAVMASRMGLLTPATFATAAAVAGLGYALYESAAQVERFDESMSGMQARMEALGKGASFDPTEIAALIDELHTLPGVSAEAATSIVEGFTTASNIGGGMVAKLTSLVGDFATASGKDIPKAAAELTKAFEEPATAGEKLVKTFHLFGPAQTEAFNAAKQLNDVAQEQAILFDALSERIAGLREKSLTPMQRADELLSESISDLTGHVGESDTLWQRMGKSIQQDTIWLKELAAVATEAGAHLGSIFDKSTYTDTWSRAPKQQGSGKTGGAPAQGGGDNEAAKRQQAQQADIAAANDAVGAFEKSNVPLREQEQHLLTIKRYQDDLNAAVRIGNAQAQRDAQALIDGENKSYAEKLKRQQPKSDDQDSEFQQMIDSLAKEGEKNQTQVDQAIIESNANVGLAKIKTAEETATEQYKLGQTTAAEELATLTDLAAQENQIEHTKFDQLAALYNDDLTKYIDVQAQKAEADQKYKQQLIQLNTDASKQVETDWDRQVKSMVSSFSSGVAGMVTGTTTFQASMTKMAEQAITQFISGFVDKMVTSFISGLGIMEAAETAFNEIFGTSSSSSDTTKNAEDQISDNAGIVFAEAFAWAIPNVGVYAAPAVAAGAATAAMAGGDAFLNSAAGGMIVDGDQIAQVHHNEMVLPARYTSGMTKLVDFANSGALAAPSVGNWQMDSSIFNSVHQDHFGQGSSAAGGRGGLGGQGGGDVHHHLHAPFSPTINGKLGPDDIQGLHAEFDKHVQKSMRNGKYGTMQVKG